MNLTITKEQILGGLQPSKRRQHPHHAADPVPTCCCARKKDRIEFTATIWT